MPEPINNNNSFSTSALVNPAGHGLQMCLTGMKDCNESGDESGYREWADLGLKYVDLQMGCGGVPAPSISSIMFV
jgi:hypothetical protein